MCSMNLSGMKKTLVNVRNYIQSLGKMRITTKKYENLRHKCVNTGKNVSQVQSSEMIQEAIHCFLNNS